VERADTLPNAEDLMNCLLVADKSKEVVGDAVFGCLEGHGSDIAGSEDKAVVASRRSSLLLGMIEMLLKTNTEAAKYRDPNGANMLVMACRSRLPTKLCIDIMQLVLALHKDVVREAVSDGWLPVHIAATSCDLEVVELLLGLFSEAASVVTSRGCNLLHLAVGDYSSSRAVPKVQYLCSRYPAMVQQRSNDGEMPAHKVASSHRLQIMPALCEAGGIEQFKMPVAHPTKANYPQNGYLPLHRFIAFQSVYRELKTNLVSEQADMFRWLLRLYPEAAGIEGGVGVDKKTPYQLAVDRDRGLPKYYLRLLLRAAPTLNPAELHRLNYAERRMAMFLAFKAMSSSVKVPLLVRLRGESKDLVQRVVSFL
jgi:hypothetical protein